MRLRWPQLGQAISKGAQPCPGAIPFVALSTIFSNIRVSIELGHYSIELLDWDNVSLSEIVMIRTKGDDVFEAVISPRSSGLHVVWVDNSMDAGTMFPWMLPAVEAAAIAGQSGFNRRAIDNSLYFSLMVYISQAGCRLPNGIS